MLAYRLQALVYDILLSTTALFSYAIGSRKLLTSSFLLVLKQQQLCYKQLQLYQMFVLQLTMLLMPAQIKPKSFEQRQNFFFSNQGWGWLCLMVMCVLGRQVASTVLSVPKPFQEGADSVAGQLRRDKECRFSGITKSGRVWRKVPESNARSVASPQTSLKLSLKSQKHGQSEFNKSVMFHFQPFPSKKQVYHCAKVQLTQNS